MDTIISLTSIPRRFDTCLPGVIQSLKRQSVRYTIVLNIPTEYIKWKGEVKIPEWITNDPDIVIFRPKKDYGPVTKLLGALEYIETRPEIKYIITVDDDMEFSYKDHIERIAGFHSKRPDEVLTFSGIRLTHHPYRFRNGLDHDNYCCYVDVPAGFFGVSYPVKRLLENIHLFKDEFISTLPSGVFHDDDAFIAIVCGIAGIPIYSFKGEYMGMVQATYDGGSAISEQMGKDRVDNECEIYQFAVSKGYLPNKHVSFTK